MKLNKIENIIDGIKIIEFRIIVYAFLSFFLNPIVWHISKKFNDVVETYKILWNKFRIPIIITNKEISNNIHFDINIIGDIFI